MNGGDNKIVPSSRSIIENKLLTALEDEGTVAILATEKDLDLLIHALELEYKTGPLNEAHRASKWLADLKQLRKVAFGR